MLSTAQRATDHHPILFLPAVDRAIAPCSAWSVTGAATARQAPGRLATAVRSVALGNAQVIGSAWRDLDSTGQARTSLLSLNWVEVARVLAPRHTPGFAIMAPAEARRPPPVQPPMPARALS